MGLLAMPVNVKLRRPGMTEVGPLLNVLARPGDELDAERCQLGDDASE